MRHSDQKNEIWGLEKNLMGKLQWFIALGTEERNDNWFLTYVCRSSTTICQSCEILSAIKNQRVAVSAGKWSKGVDQVKVLCLTQSSGATPTILWQMEFWAIRKVTIEKLPFGSFLFFKLILLVERISTGLGSLDGL